MAFFGAPKLQKSLILLGIHIFLTSFELEAQCQIFGLGSEEAPEEDAMDSSHRTVSRSPKRSG